MAEDNSIEVWKDIPKLKGYYQASSLGRIRSLDRVMIHNINGTEYIKKGRVLSEFTTQKYPRVSVSVDGKRETREVHIYVAEAFLDYSRDGSGSHLVVDHINNNPLDNRLENLQVITFRENLSKDKKNKTSKYTGVSLDRGKWVAMISVGNKIEYLGRFDCETKAHLAYQNKLKEIQCAS